MPSSTCSRCDYCVQELDDEGEEVSVCMAMPPSYVVVDGEPNYIRGAYIDPDAVSCIYWVPRANARH